MNKIFKAIVMFSVVALFSAACTKQETIGFKNLTLEEKNPELYKAYLESLRAYRATEHQVLIARVDNKASFLGRADHLNALPDSVDYVVLNYVDDVFEGVLAEMKTLRQDKGQKFLAAIDYAEIMDEYKDYLIDMEEAGEEPVKEDEFIKDEVDQFLEAFAEYQFDGMLVSYSGKNPLSMQETEKEAVKALQEAFFAPLLQRVGSTGKMLFFEGTPKTLLVEENVLGVAKYIIIPAESATSFVSLTTTVYQNLQDGVPTDKMIIGVTALDVTSEIATDGLFSGYSSAAVGAAQWSVAADEKFTKCGVCVNHAQFDYYHMGNDFCEIKAAIATMNPSPLK